MKKALLGATGAGAILTAALILSWPRGLFAPPPTMVSDTEWIPSLPISTLSVPITYDLAPVISALEEAVGREYGSLDERITVENERAAVAYVARRGPLDARLDGDVARVRTTVRYRAQGWYDPPVLPEVGASCGVDDEPAPRATIELSARLSLNEDWTLLADASVDSVTAASEAENDQCTVTPLSIDVTDRVMDAARSHLEEQLPRIEGAISSIDLRPRFEEWWSVLHEPIELADDIWLHIRPLGVRRGPTEGQGQTLATTVSLSAHPRLVLGPRPDYTVPALPPLDSAGVDEGLWIHAPGEALYDDIATHLDEHLSGEVVEVDDRRFEVRRIRVRGIGGGRVALELGFGGDVRGRLFLVGSPEFDAASGQVYVPDLDFDLASSNLLVSGYAWLREPRVRDFLRERARWPVGDLTKMAAEQLHRGLNRELTDGVWLSGQVHEVDVLGVHATRSRLVVHARARAEARLEVDT